MSHSRRAPAWARGVAWALLLGALGASWSATTVAADDAVPSPPANGSLEPAAEVEAASEGELAGSPEQGDEGSRRGTSPGPARPGAEADAAPALQPGFVDDYTRLWRRVERATTRLEELRRQASAARIVFDAAASDRSLTARLRHRAESAASVAGDDLDAAAKEMYIHGAIEVDLVVGVLGSGPDEVLRTLDAAAYLAAAGDDEARLLREAELVLATTQAADVAASTAVQRAQDDWESLDREIEAIQDGLEADRSALDALIAAAAPQTVVGSRGCPVSVLDGTVPLGVDIHVLCRRAVKAASSPAAAKAIMWALVRLGAPYACEGVGRLDPWRFDCSSYVARAYAEGAGLDTAGEGWAPSTRTMVPWDGAALDPHYARLAPDRIRPGDLVFYDTCPAGEECPYRHVAMYLGPLEPGGQAYMAHTNACGGVAHVTPFWGLSVPHLLGVRRVVAL